MHTGQMQKKELWSKIVPSISIITAHQLQGKKQYLREASCLFNMVIRMDFVSGQGERGEEF